MKFGLTALLVCAAVIPFELGAQSTFGSIVGIVKDATGSAVTRATVRVTNTDENATREVSSDDGGTYEALNLKPGRYSVVVTKPGFQSSKTDDIQLIARQTIRQDVELSVGAVEQTVTVEAKAGVIASETNTVASSYGSEKILTLPTNLRASTSTSPFYTITTLPGVQVDNSGYLTIQGALPHQTDSSIDGISAQSVRDNRPLREIFPSVEGIAEMKVQGVGNNAEYTTAGDITTITKSGTNQYHGSGAWYYQNAELDAFQYGANTKPEKKVNNFSFAGGGPVYLPKIYNGKNKTFFFADYEELRYPRTSVVQNYLPSDAMKTGDFSKEAGDLIDPTTGKPFPGRLIPANRISPIASKLLSTFWPGANTGDTAVSHDTNYVINKPSDIQSRQYDIRGDHYLTAKQSVFGRFSWKNNTNLGPNDLLVPSSSNFDQNRSFVISHNYTIKPTVLNEFRFGFTQNRNGGDIPYDGKSFEKSLGFNGLPSTPFNGLPGIGFSNLTGLGVGRTENINKYRTFQANNNTTWTLGSHTIKFGVDVRWLQTQTALGFIGADNYGQFDFNGAFTKNEFADFLLGIPADSAYADVQKDNDGRAGQYHAYIQDSFKVSRKLTLEYGVRWDYQPPFKDNGDNIGNFDRSIPRTGAVIYPSSDNAAKLLAPAFEIGVNACPGTPNLPAPGPGLEGVPCTPFKTAKQAGLSEGLRVNYKYNFAPRFGFAYRPFGNGDTVIRGGFGTFWSPILGAVFYSLTGTSGSDVRTFNNIGPDGLPVFAWPNTRTGGSGVSADQYGNAYFGTANAIDFKNPKLYQWNLSVDHNIGLNTGLRVSYIGNHSIQLGFAPNVNQSAYSTQFFALQPLQARPFPYWFRIESRDSGGTSFYNALQLELNHRYKNGLSFTGAYTFAKNITDVGGPNPTEFAGETGNGRIMDSNNRAGSRGNVYGTRRHRFISTAVYELPFGRGKHFGNSVSRMTNAVIGGWRISSIFLIQSGPWLTPYFDGGDPSGTGSGYYRTQRPDRVGSGVPANQSISQWADRSAFVCPGRVVGSADQFNCAIGINPVTDLAPIGRFGNSGVGLFQGPGTVNLSMGFGKTFEIGEHVRAKLEGSYTNLPNRINYADPRLAITNSAFGTVTGERGADFGGHRTGQVGVRVEF
jgi:hypothetical protein